MRPHPAHWFLPALLLLAMSLLSCGDAAPDDEPRREAPRTPPLRVLCVGNSYSADALNYLPAIMPKLMTDRTVTVGYLYHGGATLEEHSRHINDVSRDFYDYYESDRCGEWNVFEYLSPVEVLTRGEWDYIVLQQQSYLSTDYATYQPYLDELIAAVRTRATGTPEVVWLMTPVRPDVEPAAEQAVWQGICASTRSVVADTPIERFIPMGTAIQNARQTSLNHLGAYGRLSDDGVHLQDGLARYLAAYTVALSLLSWRGTPVTAVSSLHTIDTTALDDIGLSGVDAGETGLNTANQLLAQQCALAAVASPFAVSVPAATR